MMVIRVRASGAALLAAIVAVASCGGREPGREVSDDDVREVVITPRLVLGSEDYGDEGSLGIISDAEFLPGGGIAVIDRLACCVRVFSGSGEYLFSIGSPGEGPGRFISPDCIMPVGDSILVFDMMGGRASVFDGSGAFLGTLTQTGSVPIPCYCEYNGDGRLIGGITEEESRTHDEIIFAYRVKAFDLALQPVDTLFTNVFTFTPGDVVGRLRSTSFSCSFTTAPDGSVFVAPASTERYVVMGFDAAMDTLVTITADYPTTPKSPDEIASETERMTSVFSSRNSVVYGGFQPLPDRYMIPPSGLHADSLGRVWVQRGIDEGIVFDAYGYDGILLGSARIEGIGDLQETGPLWWSGSDCGLLAFTMDPLDYPGVFVFDLPGADAFR